MKLHFYLLIFSCFLASCSPSVKGILKTLGEKNYPKAKILLDKRQQKNPNDVASLYAYALYFSDSSNTQFDIDKAYRSIQRSDKMYHLANSKIILQLQKRHINASTLVSFKNQLEEKAFFYFKKTNTAQGFQEFIKRFAQAPQIPEAILARNQLAFNSAKKQNTYSAYKAFFEKYSDAEQVPQAKKYYEDLLFESKTKDGSLTSFADFLEEYPKTPYRKLVERKIYELAITIYALSEYENFVKTYPQNPYSQRAYQWIWHWKKDKKEALQKYTQLAQNQEIRQNLALKNVILYPKEQNKKLVFEDKSGEIRLKTDLNYEHFNRFNPQNKTFEGDIFVFKNSLNELMAIDKSGKKIVGKEEKAEYNSIKVLHTALLKVRKGNKYAIFHKGGFQVSDFEFEEIDFVNDKVLKFKKNNRWGLITPNNKTILNEKHQRISIFANQYLKLERGNQVGFADLEGFEFKKDNLKNMNAKFTFFDKRTFSISHNRYLKIRKNNRFGISTPTGKIILHPSAEKIVETPSGWAAYFRNEWRFYSFWGKQVFANRLKDIKINAQNKSLTYAVKRDAVWAILDTQFRQKTGFSYDKIDFIPHGAILENEHGKFLYLGKKEANNYISIQNYTKIDVFAFKKQHLITVQDSTNQTGLLNQKGELIFNCQYQNLKPLNAETILFNQNDKKGLISLDSTLILPADYEAIANTQEGYFSLLRNGKLGLFDLENRKLIPCQYTALVQVLNKKRGVLIAKKAKFGLINANNQVIAPFIFDEIRETQQNLIKVKHQNEWKYYNFVSKKFEKL